MIRCAVLGSPIEHSLSPLLHQSAYSHLNVEGSYTRFRVDESELEGFLLSHPPADWRGFSLTMPLKEIGLRFATELDVTALESKALNTLVSTGDTWRGYNTDVLGFRHILKNCDFQSVAILGAGGTARAALVALRNYEVTPKVYRRSDARDQALRLANENVRILPWGSHPSAFEEDLLISTVPNSALADSQTEGSLKYIIEAIYNPWPTALKSFVKRAKYLSGKELLVAQAIPQIQLFTGRQVDFEGLTNVLLEVINSPQS